MRCIGFHMGATGTDTCLYDSLRLGAARRDRARCMLNLHYLALIMFQVTSLLLPTVETVLANHVHEPSSPSPAIVASFRFTRSARRDAKRELQTMGVCAGREGFDLGFGDCMTYASGQSNAEFCAADGALEECFECGWCIEPAQPPSPPTPPFVPPSPPSPPRPPARPPSSPPPASPHPYPPRAAPVPPPPLLPGWVTAIGEYYLLTSGRCGGVITMAEQCEQAARALGKADTVAEYIGFHPSTQPGCYYLEADGLALGSGSDANEAGGHLLLGSAANPGASSPTHSPLTLPCSPLLTLLLICPWPSSPHSSLQPTPPPTQAYARP